MILLSLIGASAVPGAGLGLAHGAERALAGCRSIMAMTTALLGHHWLGRLRTACAGAHGLACSSAFAVGAVVDNSTALTLSFDSLATLLGQFASRRW